MRVSQVRWCVIQTQPHWRAKAAPHLNRQGFETYMPRYLKRQRLARRVETVYTPLFPRYLLVRSDLATQRWRAIHSTVGISRLLCNGEDPAPIADQFIASLRAREGADGLVRLEPQRRLAPGEPVRILDGARASCLGLYEGPSDAEHVKVLLDLPGRKVRLIVDDLSIVAA